MGRLWGRLAIVPLAALLACASPDSVGGELALPPAVTAAATPAPPVPSPWRLVYSTDFPLDAPLGSFSGCEASTYTCTGLPAALQSQWWAYPDGWPDTATQWHMPVGGYYSPSTTVWIAAGVMNIKLWRGMGSVHSAAVLPKAAMGRVYGKYVETFRVPDPVLGYKSAHMLWATPKPTNGSPYEIDFPEAGWGVNIKAFIHSDTSWSHFMTATAFDRTWHTSVIEWTPKGLSLYLDGKLVGSLKGRVTDVPMRWILQNETQTNGTYPRVNSSSTMQIRYVAYYSWVG